MNRIHYPEDVPHHATNAPFSPLALIAGGGLMVLSGQGPMSTDGEVMGQSIGEQTEVVFNNALAKLEAVGGCLRDVFRTTIYLADLSDWAEFNEVYARRMPRPYPTRTSVGVQLLAGMKVEIDFWAVAR